MNSNHTNRFLLTLSVLCFAIQTANSQSRLFTTESNTLAAAAMGAYQVEVSDLDGDGDLDVLSASWKDNKVAWYENFGNGKFSVQKIITMDAKNARSVYAADLDGDGHMDVLSASRDDNKIAWYRNSGYGQFGLPRIISDSADGAMYVHATDLDGDGDVDVLSASENDDKVNWYENIGGGTFDKPKTITDSADRVVFVVAADIDSDGDEDVLSVSRNDKTIAWYKNDGNGTFSSRKIISNKANGCEALGVADLDNDGDLDITAGTHDGGRIVWFENVGKGEFSSAKVLHSTAQGSNDVEPADVDGDGDLDLVAALSFDSKVFWHENLGKGVFGPQRSIPGHAYAARSVVCADLDLDGDQDVLSASMYDNKIAWYENLGNDTFAYQVEISTKGGHKVWAADMDKDGDKDVLSCSYNYNRVLLYENRGGGHFSNPVVIGRDGYNANAIFSSDLNNNGYLDVLIATENNQIGWYSNSGSNKFGSFKLVSQQVQYPEEIVAGDFDGDGDNDILATAAFERGVYLFENDGKGNFGSKTLIGRVNHCASLRLDDLDGDGDLDVLASSYGDGSVLWQENLGNMTFSPIKTISSNAYQALGVYSADLSGDGKPDIISCDRNSVAWYKNLGKGGFGSKSIISNNLDRGSDVFAADLDLDGDIDVVSSSMSDNTISWYENLDNDKFASQVIISNQAMSARSVLASDLDNDGDVDIISGSHTENKIAWYENHLNDPSISGIVFFDLNNNGIKDPDERGMPNARTNVLPNSVGYFTSGDGNFQYFLSDGNYSISYDSSALPLWTLTTDSISYEVTVSESSKYSPLYFGLMAKDSISKIEVVINSGRTRCNEKVKFDIALINSGTLIEEGVLWLNLDSFVQGIELISTPDTVVGKYYFGWFFSDVYPGESIHKVLNLDMPGIGNGFSLGNSILIEAHVETKNVISANYKYEPIIRCSYDPNDKQVTPGFDDRRNYTQMNTPLTYTIRFQNTGNDTAKTVIIRDTLDNNLDLKTFSLLSSSHNEALSVRLTHDSCFVFEFENIFLPDSNTNFSESQGYVCYRIRPKGGMVDSTIVRNKASIYFDSNPPIITNTTENVFVKNLVSINEVTSLPVLYWTVFPNPFSNNLTIELKNYKLGSRLVVINALGQEVCKKEIIGQKVLLNTQSWGRGVYYILLNNKEGNLIGRKKVVHFAN